MLRDVKLFLKVALCGTAFSVGLGFSNCSSGPRIRECMVSVDSRGLYDVIQTSPDVLQGLNRQEFYDVLKSYVVADCIDWDGNFSERSLQELDGHFAVNYSDKETLLLWARARCQGAR